MKYSIDSSALMDGWIRYYPPDVIPGLWDKLEDMIEAGELVATEEVLVELERQEDSLCDWAGKHENMFISIDEPVQLAVRNILGRYPKLINVKKSKSMADPFVVALAQVQGAKVLTGERRKHPTDVALNSKNQVRIPDVCRVLGIPCCDIVGFCRDQGLVFHL